MRAQVPHIEKSKRPVSLMGHNWCLANWGCDESVDCRSPNRGQQRNPWIKDPLFDWAFIHIGVILLPLVCLLRYAADFTFERGYFLVMLLLWAGHHLTPIFLLYADRRVHDLAIRHAPKLKLGILATVLLPLAAYVAASGLYWETGRHTAWTYMPIAIVSLIYLLWSSYHICAQHFGIMQLYRKRMGLISAGARAFEMKLFVITLTVLRRFSQDSVSHRS